MKSKILALSKNEEFKNLLKQKKITNKYVSIFFGKLLNKDKTRLNISFVTKKKIGNAVKRNKIKRRIKSIISQQPLSASEDLYIKVLRGADKATYNELNKDILNALEAQK